MSLFDKPDCRQALISLFDFRELAWQRIGENCHNDEGCTGCITEEFMLDEPTINLKAKEIHIPYTVKRTDAHGHCFGSQWRYPIDPNLYGKLIVSVKTNNGNVIVDSISNEFQNGECRPTWVLDHTIPLVQSKNGMGLNCNCQ